MRLRVVTLAATVLIVAFAALSGGPQAQSLTGEYKIGVLEPLTGPLASEASGTSRATRSCAT